MSNRLTHLLCTVSAATVAAAITIAAHLWGRGAMGNVIGLLGLPGVVANGDGNSSNVLFGFVNWLFYLSVFEVAVFLTRHLRHTGR